MTTVAIHTAPDGLLAVVAPLGCALASTSALVIDLDEGGLPALRTEIGRPELEGAGRDMMVTHHAPPSWGSNEQRIEIETGRH